jgi:hypothetical protein
MPSDPSVVRWRVHLRSAPERAYEMLASQEGREAFWAERAPERDGVIHFEFANGERVDGDVLRREPGRCFSVRYFEGKPVRFEIEPDGAGGSEVTVIQEGVTDDNRDDFAPGWVVVLLALKAAADFGVDLRNHSATRTWEAGYVDV